MSDQAFDTPVDDSSEGKKESKVWTKKDIIWSLPQPILVLGSMALVATMITGQCIDHKLFAVVMIMLPILLVIFAERTCASFIYCWPHRVQHESLFRWRMHATHHHITKMG